LNLHWDFLPQHLDIDLHLPADVFCHPPSHDLSGQLLGKTISELACVVVRRGKWNTGPPPFHLSALFLAFAPFASILNLDRR